MVTGFAFGIPVGLVMYRALAPLERGGPIVTLLVRWWSWFVARATGTALLVGIAGPYVFAGAYRGTYNSNPTTQEELLWITSVQALAYTLCSMWQDRARSRRLRQLEAVDKAQSRAEQKQHRDS
ncbi:MAG: hypothetical protein ACR2M1_13045 [Gemmatimonadaceae bacterium]